MPVEFACRCGKRFSLDDSMAGKKGRCAACGAIVEAPTRADPPASSRRDRPGAGSGNGLGRGRSAVAGVIAFALAAAGCGAGYHAWKELGGPRKAMPRVAAAKPGNGPRPTARPPAPRVAQAPPAVPVAATAGPPAAAGDPRPMATDEIVARSEGSVGVIRGVDSLGAGFVVGPGLVATNAHVIRRMPGPSIRVSFPSAPAGQRGPHSARVLHFDDGRDLAILAVSTALPPLPIAEGYAFRRGQDVVFIGSPGLGGMITLENVAARGVLGSRVRVDDLDYYQLSGSVNPGNSGGPVLDPTGRVVAVVTARAIREEGIGLCVPVAALVEATRAASARDPARVADAGERHEASAKLASVVLPREGAVELRGERFAAEFLRGTEPATWLASVDANLILKDTSPRVAPFRQRLRRADTIYLEDERVIAGMAIRFVAKVKDAGLPISCATLLESSLTSGRGAYSLDTKPRSFLAFAEAYVDLRVNERLGHRETMLRMEGDAKDRPATARAEPGPDSPPPPPRPAASPRPAPKLAGPDSPSGKLEAARNLEAGDSKGLAIAAYEALIVRFPLTMEAGIAKNRLKVLRPDPGKAKSSYDPNKIVPRG